MGILVEKALLATEETLEKVAAPPETTTKKISTLCSTPSTKSKEMAQGEAQIQTGLATQGVSQTQETQETKETSTDSVAPRS